MSKLTIDEVKEMKSQLEKAIFATIEEFESTTNAIIESIEIQRAESIYGESICIDIRAEVRVL